MTGKIDTSALSTLPEQLELETAGFFANLGKNISFIRPSSIPNQHRPDIIMDGIEWEIKCPIGESKRTIENNLRKALLQSQNIIFDLRHTKLPEEQSISQLKSRFKRTSQIRKLYIIKRSGEFILLKK